MPKIDVWSTIHAERKALADDLAGLTDAQWATASLCAGWSVRDVLAHMTGTATMTPLKFFPKFVAAGFSLPKLQAKDIARERGRTPADTLANFAAQINSSKSPPGPKDTWLGETIVHAEDIRRPLGLKHTYPADAAAQVADFYKTSNLVIGAKKRIAGLALESHGRGLGPRLRARGIRADRRAGDGDGRPHRRDRRSHRRRRGRPPPPLTPHVLSVSVDESP